MAELGLSPPERTGSTARTGFREIAEIAFSSATCCASLPVEPMDSQAQIDTWLAPLLDLPLDQREAQLDQLCREHPDHEAVLRDQLASALRMIDAASVVSATRPDQFGPYDLVRRIGGGGMGDVYEALERSPAGDRRVALKLIHRQASFARVARERFRREAAALSRLDHPAICPVFGGCRSSM